MSDEELLESIDNRLKWLLRFQAEEHFDEEASTRDKVKTLHRMGFGNEEMAEIIGTSKTNITTTLSRLRGDGEIDD